MAAASDMMKTPTQYMSGRGRYWQVVPPSAAWPAFMAVRLNADKTAEQGVQPVMAGDFTSLAMAIEKFETDEASKAVVPGKAPGAIEPGVAATEKSEPMKDSTKLLIAGVGLGVVALGAYFMMRKPSPYSSPRTRVLDDLESASSRLEPYPSSRSRF